MKTLTFAALLTGISLSSLAAGPLSHYRWKNRILILDFSGAEAEALAEF